MTGPSTGAALAFGLVIYPGGLTDAVADMEKMLEVKCRGYVVTPNVDHIVRYQNQESFRQACASAVLHLPDGVPVVWAARRLGIRLKERVAGADLLPAVCRMAAARGFTVFLMGGGRGVAQRAAEALVLRFSGLRIVGTHTPPGDFTADGPAAELAVAAVARAHPDILFVGLGSPKQELWVHRHWDRLACTVAICCGAAIDYAAGVKPRAPLWMQRAGLEWLWRLAHEPRRLWRRYLVDDVAFLGIFLREWWRLRVRKSQR